MLPIKAAYSMFKEGFDGDQIIAYLIRNGMPILDAQQVVIIMLLMKTEHLDVLIPLTKKCTSLAEQNLALIRENRSLRGEE